MTTGGERDGRAPGGDRRDTRDTRRSASEDHASSRQSAPDIPNVVYEADLPEPILTEAGPTRVGERIKARSGYRWWVLGTVLSGLFATGLTITVLTTAVPFIRQDFGASLAAITWVVSAPFLFRSIFVPAFGRAADLVGRRLLWLSGFGVATVASLACGFAPNVGSLIAFRAIAATASAAVIPASLALIAEAFEPDERVKALGWWAATIAISPLLGVILGGFVVEALGWRWLFFAQFPFGVVAFALGVIVLRESRSVTKHPFDAVGCALSIVGFGAMLLAFNRGPVGEWSFTSVELLSTLVVAVAALVMFGFHERRVEAPIIPVDYFRKRRFSGAVGANFCANFAYMGGFFITSLLLADPGMFDYAADKVALGVSPRAASLGLMGPIGGYMAARYGGRRMAVLGMVCLFASMLVLAAVDSTTPYWWLLPGLVLSGFGLGLVMPPSAATVTNESSPDDLASTSGALSMGASIGASLGIVAMQAVLIANAASPDLPGAGAYRASFLFGAAISILGLFAAWNLSRAPTRRAQVAPDPPDGT